MVDRYSCNATRIFLFTTNKESLIDEASNQTMKRWTRRIRAFKKEEKYAKAEGLRKQNATLEEDSACN